MTWIISPTVAEMAPTLGPIRQTYARQGDFPPLTRSYTALAAIIRESGLMRRTPWFYALVGVAIAIGFAGVITAAVFIGDSWWQLVPAFALGILFTQVAFLAHEAAHRQILTRGPANLRLARVLIAIVGMSFSWWDNKHTRHHANPNQAHKDPDVAMDTISFLEEDARTATGLRKLITRKQGWLFFPLLTLEGLNLHMHSVRHLLRLQKTPGRFIELGMLAVRTVLVFGPIFAFLPLGKALAFVAVMLAVFGVYMGGVFAPNHKGMPIIAPDARLDFFSKQVRTSRNIRGGWWATSLMGGLNYQIEHHLFPSMARPYLAQTRLIVQEFCKTEGVPYTETTLRQSYARVIAYLNEVGLAARDPFECPLLASRA